MKLVSLESVILSCLFVTCGESEKKTSLGSGSDVDTDTDVDMDTDTDADTDTNTDTNTDIDSGVDTDNGTDTDSGTGTDTDTDIDTDTGSDTDPSCSVVSDCFSLMWNIYCLGHWFCNAGTCEPVCNMCGTSPCCGDGICDSLFGTWCGECPGSCYLDCP